jgi:hypothetical protein
VSATYDKLRFCLLFQCFLQLCDLADVVFIDAPAEVEEPADSRPRVADPVGLAEQLAQAGGGSLSADVSGKP